MKKIFLLLLIVTVISCNKEKVSSEESKESYLKPLENPNAKRDLYFAEGITKIKNLVVAPDFTLTDLEGNNFTLSDYKGQVVFINFWASWCGPCIEEMPSIESLYQKTKDLDIKIITINVSEPFETVKRYIDNNDYNFKVLLDKSGEISKQYGARSIPSTLIINKEGNFAGAKLGAHTWDSNNIVTILKEL